MVSNAQRLAAARKIAADNGAPLASVLDALAPSWGLTPFELAKMKHDGATTPAPLSDAEIATRQQAVATARVEREARIQAAHIEAGEAYLAAPNPFARAGIMNANPHAVCEGLKLIRSTEKDDPPPTAA